MREKKFNLIHLKWGSQENREKQTIQIQILKMSINDKYFYSIQFNCYFSHSKRSKSVGKKTSIMSIDEIRQSLSISFSWN